MPKNSQIDRQPRAEGIGEDVVVDGGGAEHSDSDIAMIFSCFDARGQSYKEGMLLLLDHLTDKDWARRTPVPAKLEWIKKNLQARYLNYHDALTSVRTFEEANKCFNDLLSGYQGVLKDNTTLENPFQALIDAERCVVWLEGRGNLETSLDLDADSSTAPSSELPNLVLRDFTLTQKEVPMTDSELLRKEYATITSDKPPLWFQWLPKWEQKFICAHWKLLCKQSIPAALRTVPGLANLSAHSCVYKGIEVSHYNRSALPVPVTFELFVRESGQDNHVAQKHQCATDEEFRLTCLNLASQIRLSLEQQLAKQTVDKQATDKPSPPYLCEAVILVQSLLSPGFAAGLKSKLVSNASDNDTQLYKMKELAVELFQQAFQKPGVEITDPQIKAIFFSEQEQASTLRYGDFLEKWGFACSGRGWKYQDFSIGKVTLLSTNRPYNGLRRFGEYSQQAQCNDKNTALLFAAVSRYLEKNVLPVIIAKHRQAHNRFTNQNIGGDKTVLFNNLESLKNWWDHVIKILGACAEGRLVSEDNTASLMKVLDAILADSTVELKDNTRQLLDALQALLSGSNSHGRDVLVGDARHQQALLGIAETKVVHCLDGTLWTACKSGKDRTGVASAAIDAAAVYAHDHHGKLPRYGDGSTERDSYLSNLKSLLESGHHQNIAAENAPGSRGIMYPPVPRDLVLDAGYCRLATSLARLNKPVNHRAFSERHQGLFVKRIVEKNLAELEGTVRTDREKKNTTGLLVDWKRNWGVYSINGQSVKELRNGKEFANENDVLDFITDHLLCGIQDENLKKCLLEFAPYALHQGGFQHAVGHMIANKEAKDNLDRAKKGKDRGRESFAWLHPLGEEMRMNFEPLKNGIRIEELNTYRRKQYSGSDKHGFSITAGDSVAEHGGYYFQMDACISLMARADKDGQYALCTEVDDAAVNCSDEQFAFLFPHSIVEEVYAAFQALFALILQIFGKFLHQFATPSSTTEKLSDQCAASVGTDPLTAEGELVAADTACLTVPPPAVPAVQPPALLSKGSILQPVVVLALMHELAQKLLPLPLQQPWIELLLSPPAMPRTVESNVEGKQALHKTTVGSRRPFIISGPYSPAFYGNRETPQLLASRRVLDCGRPISDEMVSFTQRGMPLVK